MQKDKKYEFRNLDDGNITQYSEQGKSTQGFTHQMREQDKGKNKGKEVGVSTLTTIKAYSKCSSVEKEKVHITNIEDDDDSDLLGEDLMAMKNCKFGSSNHTMWNM